MLRSLLLALMVASGATAQPAADATDSEDIATKIIRANILGWSLYAYDQAAWHGTDAVMPLVQADPEQADARVRGYVVEEMETGWRVAFGRLSADSSAFLSAYEGVLDSASQVVSAEAFDVPIERTGFLLDAFIARSLAFERYEKPFEVTYNTAVLPAPDGGLYAYVLPAQPAFNAYYVGADVRYRYDPESRALTDSTRLHDGIIAYDLREEPLINTFMQVDTLPLGVPSGTDVFYAMSRPSAPSESGMKPIHRIETSTHVFQMGPRGTVAFYTRDEWDALRASPPEAPAEE